jgi:hypothetical protein
MTEKRKRCSHCRTVLPASAFGSDKVKVDGLQSRCKECAAHGDVIDLGILDECWSLDETAEQAIRPAMLTKPAAQL